MPNTDAPHGFDAHAPFYGMEEFETISSEDTDVFIGDVVDALTTGYVSPAAADSNVIVGIANSYLSSSATGKVRVHFDPHQSYSVQCVSGTTPAVADYFANANHIAGAGSTTTKKSAHELNIATLSTSDLGFMILGAFPQVGNNATQQHAEYRVRLNEHALQKAGGV